MSVRVPFLPYGTMSIVTRPQWVNTPCNLTEGLCMSSNFVAKAVPDEVSNGQPRRRSHALDILRVGHVLLSIQGAQSSTLVFGDASRPSSRVSPPVLPDIVASPYCRVVHERVVHEERRHSQSSPTICAPYKIAFVMIAGIYLGASSWRKICAPAALPAQYAMNMID